MKKAEIGTEVVITKEGTHKFAVGDHVIISELNPDSSNQEIKGYLKGDTSKDDFCGWLYDYEFDVVEDVEKEQENKFKQGDILVQKSNPENVVIVTQVTDQYANTYAIKAIHGDDVGESWYEDDYLWTRGTIEDCYRKAKTIREDNITEELNVGDTVVWVKEDRLQTVIETQEDEDYKYTLSNNPEYAWCKDTVEEYCILIKRVEVEEKEEKLSRYDELRERYNDLIEERHELAVKIEDLVEEREEINAHIDEIEFEWKKMLKD